MILMSVIQEWNNGVVLQSTSVKVLHSLKTQPPGFCCDWIDEF